MGAPGGLSYWGPSFLREIAMPFLVREISVTIDDKIYYGTYYVQQSLVYVQSAFGSKATKVGWAPPETLAKLLLSELVRELQRGWRRPDGIFINPFESGAIGPDLFRAACDMGLEGLVSKRGDRPYQGGRSPHWIKVKNRAHQGFDRAKESFASPR
jgi:hypothetical protein